MPYAYTLIRPVTLADLDALYALTCMASGGLSSLQSDRDFLAGYIEASLQSFAGTRASAAGCKYLLMAQNSAGTLIGCAAVKTRIGSATAPFINFDISTDGKFLTASDRFAGATEVGSLFLHPDHRRSGIGRYLAKARYLLIAARPEQFSQTVIAELRGVSEDTHAPFYDAVFKARLGHSFLEADHHYATTGAAALALVPSDDPVAISDLPALARRAIGRPHPSGLGALKLLHSEGFADTRTVDLFDSGPIVAAYRDKISTVIDSKMVHVEACESGSHFTERGTAQFLIATDSLSEFKAIVCTGRKTRRRVTISAPAYGALGVAHRATYRTWTQAAVCAESKVSHV